MGCFVVFVLFHSFFLFFLGGGGSSLWVILFVFVLGGFGGGGLEASPSIVKTVTTSQFPSGFGCLLITHTNWGKS